MATAARLSVSSALDSVDPEPLPPTPVTSSSSEDESDLGASDAPPRSDSDPLAYRKEDEDFIWLITEEPHKSRRMAIMKSHPSVTKLMGHEPMTKYLVLLVVSLQFAVAYYLRSTHPLSFKFIALAYCIGATANQNLFLAIHEITHNLAFRSINANRYLAIFANLPIGLPYAMLFKRYHIEHHKFLGEDGIDTDLPSKWEAMVLNNIFGKTFFCTFQILFYAIRPGFIRSQRFTRWHTLNFAVVFSVDYLLVRHFGWYSYFYLVMSSFLAGSLHPCAGHFIAEHYLFHDQRTSDHGQPQETASYYGLLNVLTYNVGYHQEHHDFPAVPWTRLPALHQLAKDYYDPLYVHKSWTAVIYRFIFQDSVGMYSRVKRVPKTQKARPPPHEEIRSEGGKGSFGGITD